MLQLWTPLLSATIKKAIEAGSVATEVEAAVSWKCNDHDNYCFQPVSIETAGVYGKLNALFLSCLAKKFVDMSGDPREWQWCHQRLSMAVVRGTLPAFWPVCKFDLILATPNVPTNTTTNHLLLFNWIAIAFRMFILCVSFVVPLCSAISDFLAFLTNA